VSFIADIMLRQWNEVEQRVVEIAKKRIRTSAALGIAEQGEASGPAQASRGNCEIKEGSTNRAQSDLEDVDDHVQKIVAKAVVSIGMMVRL
jgi:hypothetical protein